MIELDNTGARIDLDKKKALTLLQVLSTEGGT